VILTYNDKYNNAEQILCIEDILKQYTDKKDVKFIAKLSFERIRKKIHNNKDLAVQRWQYRVANNILERLEAIMPSLTEKVRRLIALNELMFEDCIATEYELFSLGFGYGRSSVNTEDDESLYSQMKTEIITDTELNEFFRSWKADREWEIMVRFPELFQDIEKYKNLKRYLETIEVQNTEPVVKINEHPNKTVLKADYPQFETDLPILLSNQWLIETETGYKWLKTKNALAYYFKNMKPTRERDWGVIERAFSVDGLKNSSRSEYDKLPRDYEKLIKLLSGNV
jgi:hypothetical protein